MKRRIVLAATAAAVLIAGGATTAVAVNTGGPGGPQSGAQTAAQLAATAGAEGPAADGGRDRREAGEGKDAARATGAKTDAAQAAVAALRAVPGTVTEIELDEERGALVWEADVLGRDGAWHHLTLDPLTTRLLRSHTDRDTSGTHGQDRARAALRGTTVDAASAARAAARGQATVVSVEFEDDHARAVWEVETVTRDGREHTSLVDPRTAAVSAAPADDDHDDD
ncbi:PepSY domain-containing protein [Streptomyces catenulae]|uniref:PepSY domain-containing protein n=1 Tax=Streptomyces catenulae TaxID=66875 RepID=A0ABV2YV58_9ACTN|nr:PepSY domain-containing protein [Streptomyces catenulae]